MGNHVLLLCFLSGLINLCCGQNDLTTPVMIAKNGFPAESHEVTTDDDYILTLHRIPGTKSEGYDKSLLPVFLQHGLLDSSSGWILRGPDNSLAYMLASKGYDVWLGNVRGNTYSRKHISLDPDNNVTFWDWSWHEIGLHDIPASIDYVLRKTGHSKLTYVGHSMGTTVFFVMCSLLPEYNEKVHRMVALAPVAFISHTTSHIRYFAPFVKNLERIYDMIGRGEFLSRHFVLTRGVKLICEKLGFKKMCAHFLFAIVGHNSDEFLEEMVSLITDHNPAGTSVKTFIHYAQGIESSRFGQFDYGEDNIQKYNSDVPPSYNLSRITAPIYMYYAENDQLSDHRDVHRLANSIDSRMLYKVNSTQFNHLDFLWGSNVKELINDKVVKIISGN